MTLCPVDLDICARPECAGLYCAQSGESRLVPCLECGVLIVLRGAVICIDCLTVESVQPAEA